MTLNKFKTLLEQQKEEIVIFIKNHQPDIDFEGDETDEIQAKIIARSDAQILARKQEKLVKIEAALKKISTGANFGQCESCGDYIAEKRLLFNPVFNTCISCAEELEILKKNRAR
jgi:DnaK suppressor protein